MTALMPAAAIPRITHADATAVAAAAYEQLLDLLGRLDDAQWGAVTECAPWTVADMVGHLIGAAKANMSILLSLRQQARGLRHARKHDGNALDAVNELQVAEHRHLTNAERLSALRDIALPSARTRTSRNALLRAIRIPLMLNSGSAMPGTQKTMTLGQVLEVIYTRDVWLHGVDIERATGVKVDRTGWLDARIIEDCVGDWFALHGQPATLHLTGPAGGSYVQGEGGPVLTLDAVEWARTVSGREKGEGLLAHPVLF